MTNRYFKTLQYFLLVTIAASFASCLKDDCSQFYSYKLYKPVYMNYDQLRQ
jgi:hypothetical protein